MDSNSLPLLLASACTSKGDFIWQIVLAFILFYLSWVISVAGSKGIIRFRFLRKLQDHKNMAKKVAIFIWAVGLLVLMSTLFGWGC